MTDREREEYRALRATIRDRGTVRVWLFVLVQVAWAAATVATASLVALPIASLLPLQLLAAGFEAIFGLHTGVERVGRYLQVFYADAPEREWERTAMAYGRAHPGGPGSVDPLFPAYFISAATLNFVPVLLAEPVPLEIAVIGAMHLAFIARIVVARHHASKQRALDLSRFERLKEEAGRARS